MANASRNIRKYRRNKLDLSRTLKMLEFALAQRDQARYLAKSLEEELIKYVGGVNQSRKVILDFFDKRGLLEQDSKDLVKEIVDLFEPKKESKEPDIEILKVGD